MIFQFVRNQDLQKVLSLVSKLTHFIEIFIFIAPALFTYQSTFNNLKQINGMIKFRYLTFANQAKLHSMTLT